MKTDVVWFHVDKQGGNPYHRKSVSYQDMLRWSISSVRREMPQARCVLLTSTNTVVPDGFDAVLKADMQDQPLMLANVAAQSSFIEVTKAERVLFIDSDILLQRSFDGPFMVMESLQADLGVTFRTNMPLMPYNYGVILARPSVLTRMFFRELHARVKKMNPELQDWYANQVALAESLGRRDLLQALREDNTVIQIGALRCLLFTCDLYNFTPEQESDITPEKFALHFKGNRKELMKRIAENQTETKETAT